MSGMCDEYSIAMGQAFNKAGQVAGILVESLEIIDAGEALVGADARLPESLPHLPAGSPDKGSFQPGQATRPERGPGQIRVPNVRPRFSRPAQHEWLHHLCNAGQLMRVEMPINKIRPRAVFLNKELVMGGDNL